MNVNHPFLFTHGYEGILIRSAPPEKGQSLTVFQPASRVSTHALCLRNINTFKRKNQKLQLIDLFQTTYE
jgi:hypothetical protein